MSKYCELRQGKWSAVYQTIHVGLSLACVRPDVEMKIRMLDMTDEEYHKLPPTKGMTKLKDVWLKEEEI